MTREEQKDKLSKDYRKYREDCGIKDPVLLDEIENAYYEGMTEADKHPWNGGCCGNCYEVTDFMPLPEKKK